MTLFQFGKLILLLTRYPIAIQSLVNRIQQVFIPEGLSQKLHRAGFHGLHRHRNISMTSDEDDGNPDAGFSQLPLKIQTANLREFDVQNQTTWSVRPLTAARTVAPSRRSRPASPPTSAGLEWPHEPNRRHQ